MFGVCAHDLTTAAKNLALMGIGKLALYDTSPCTHADMAANWAIHEADVAAKRGRVEASLPSITELNGYVTVSCHEAGLSASDLAPYNVRAVLCWVESTSYSYSSVPFAMCNGVGPIDVNALSQSFPCVVCLRVFVCRLLLLHRNCLWRQRFV